MLHTINTQQPLFVRHVTGGASFGPTFQEKLHAALEAIAEEGFSVIVDIRYAQSTLSLPGGDGFTEYSALILYR